MSDRTDVPEDVPEAGTLGNVTGEELATLRKAAGERDQFEDRWLRLQAEFQNYQKRSQREREMERKYAFGPLAESLLPIYDNLDRAIVAAKNTGDAGPLVQGVSMVLTQFLELLKRHGITRIDCDGKPFDPNLHQAIMQKPLAELPENSIVQVIEQGFMNQDRVLRPAKVIVSTRG